MEQTKQPETSQENQLGTAPIGKLLFTLAVPAITAQVVNMLYNIVDRIYIGHIPEIGTAALTGVGITFPIITLISAFSSLIAMGGAPRASIAMGAHHPERAEQIMGNCLTALLGLSVVLTALFLLFLEPILWAFGASSNTIGYAMEYMGVYVWGTVFVQISLGMNMFITSQGFAKTSMFTVVIGAALNIALDPVFIFVFDLGVRGAAIATVLSQAVSAVWVMLFLTGRRTTLKVRARCMVLRWKVLLPVLALGVSPFIMQSTESLLCVVLNTSLLKYGGDVAVGAYTVIASIMQVINLPLQGLTQGAQPITSFNYGAGKHGPGAQVCPAAAHLLPDLQLPVLAVHDADPPGVHRHLQQRPGTDGHRRVGRPDLPLRLLRLWGPDRLPAELPGPGPGQGLPAAGPAAEDRPAHPPDLPAAPVLPRQALRGVRGGTHRRHSGGFHHHLVLPGVRQEETERQALPHPVTAFPPLPKGRGGFVIFPIFRRISPFSLVKSTRLWYNGSTKTPRGISRRGAFL